MYSQLNWNLELLVFVEEPGEKPSKQGQDPKTNSTHMRPYEATNEGVLQNWCSTIVFLLDRK